MNISASEITRLEVLGYHQLSVQDKQDFTALFARTEIYPISKAIVELGITLRQQKKMLKAMESGAELLEDTADDFRRETQLLFKNNGQTTMQTAIKTACSREEYLAFEETAELKHEFYQGKIFAMTGGTFNHAKISVNTLSALNVKLRGKSCQVMNNDMRINTPSGLDTYPDISAFCGEPLLTDKQRTLLNPILLIEVLSPSTRRYDQSDKFTLYRAISTLHDYLLIDSEKILVQHFQKIKEGEWLLREYFALTDTIHLNSIEESISLTEMYEGVNF